MSQRDDRPTLPQPKGLFAELGSTDIEALLDAGEPVSFSAGEAIFETGDQGDAMYVILAGRRRSTWEVDSTCWVRATSSARWR